MLQNVAGDVTNGGKELELSFFYQLFFCSALLLFTFHYFSAIPQRLPLKGEVNCLVLHECLILLGILYILCMYIGKAVLLWQTVGKIVAT